MTPREIIAEAWAITTKERPIRRWAFTSSFFETLLDVKLLVYQVYFAYEHFYGSGDAGFFDIEILIYQSLPFGVFLAFMIFFILLIVVEIFLPHLCTGAIIGLAAKSYRKEDVKGGLVLGLYNFFAIFGIHEFLVLAGVSTVVTASSLILRYVEAPLSYWSISILLFFFVLSNVLRFFFSFANQAAVLQKMNIFEAMGKSFKLIVSHLSHVMFLLLLLFVITIRIVLNIAMLILIPGIIVAIGYLLALFISPIVSYTIAGIVGVGLVIAASYFFAYLQAFKHTVWTITYLELIKQKDLDEIL
ncbi:hypothetical protein K8942_04765 [Candidatus Peribacteria bacterium]|nr:MAG: hypothetical protein K8942_04765 [Candidatus Peribacteria bacterium]